MPYLVVFDVNMKNSNVACVIDKSHLISDPRALNAFKLRPSYGTPR